MEQQGKIPVTISPLISSRELCAVFAHEIAAPLNNISGGIAALQQHLYSSNNGAERVDDTTGELLRLIRGEVNRLTLLLEDFRSFRFLSLELRPTSLATVIENCLALASIKNQQRPIRIDFAVPFDLPPVFADEAKLRQVFLNLYQNALDAMPNGGTITVRARGQQRQVCLDFADTGEGVSEGAQIFEPFVTKKPGGTGLGLAVVKWIIAAHGGAIDYASTPGGGTVFHLTFVPATGHALS